MVEESCQREVDLCKSLDSRGKCWVMIVSLFLKFEVNFLENKCFLSVFILQFVMNFLVQASGLVKTGG